MLLVALKTAVHNIVRLLWWSEAKIWWLLCCGNEAVQGCLLFTAQCCGSVNGVTDTTGSGGAK